MSFVLTLETATGSEALWEASGIRASYTSPPFSHFSLSDSAKFVSYVARSPRSQPVPECSPGLPADESEAPSTVGRTQTLLKTLGKAKNRRTSASCLLLMNFNHVMLTIN